MAANPLEGEVDVTIAGKAYTLCFPTRAIVQVEKLLEDGIGEIGGKVERIEYLAALAWGALQKYHSDVDLLAAYDLLDKCEGGIQTIGDPVVRALRFRLSRTAVDAPLVAEKPEAE